MSAQQMPLLEVDSQPAIKFDPPISMRDHRLMRLHQDYLDAATAVRAYRGKQPGEYLKIVKEARRLWGVYLDAKWLPIIRGEVGSTIEQARDASFYLRYKNEPEGFAVMWGDVLLVKQDHVQHEYFNRKTRKMEPLVIESSWEPANQELLAIWDHLNQTEVIHGLARFGGNWYQPTEVPVYVHGQLQLSPYVQGWLKV